MDLGVTAGDFSKLSRDLDDAASEAATATLRPIASSVSDAMPGAGSGATMAQATDHFDENLRLFAEALSGDSEAAAHSDGDFTATDRHGEQVFKPAVFDPISDSIKYGR